MLGKILIGANLGMDLMVLYYQYQTPHRIFKIPTRFSVLAIWSDL